MACVLDRCFFCGMPLDAGNSVAGVACDSPICQRDLVSFLGALSERYGGHKKDPLEMAGYLFDAIDRTAELAIEIRDARNELIDLIRSLKAELIWLDNFANPEKLHSLRTHIDEIREKLESITIAKN